MAEEAVELVKNESRGRYELRVGGKTAGYLTYSPADGVVELIHTVVPPEHGGKGYGGRLAEFALGDIRDSGFLMKPTCPFVARHIERHPEYAPLVVTD